jgi:4-hydroxy-tetrahydrodipicolinate reductase
MKIAVWGAKGRVGSKVCEIAATRGHTIFGVDKESSASFDAPCDVVIDFSLPSCIEQIVKYCTTYKVPLVAGTTGHNKNQLALLEKLKQQVPVIVKANYGKGMEIVSQICREVAAKSGWDVAIVERHHKGKIDSPSGTAKMLANMLDCHNVLSMRAGNEFGTHTIVFGGIDECIEITHRATSVDVFALGAIEAAENLVGI